MKELEIRKRRQEEDKGRGGGNREQERRTMKGEKGEKKSVDKSHGFALKKGQG